jgi:hypothetical protein
LCGRKTGAVGRIISEVMKENCASNGISLCYSSAGPLQESSEVEFRRRGRKFCRQIHKKARLESSNIFWTKLRRNLVMYFIYYAEVMWFSRGNVLKQFFNLRA